MAPEKVSEQGEHEMSPPQTAAGAQQARSQTFPLDLDSATNEELAALIQQIREEQMARNQERAREEAEAAAAREVGRQLQADLDLGTRQPIPESPVADDGTGDAVKENAGATASSTVDATPGPIEDPLCGRTYVWGAPGGIDEATYRSVSWHHLNQAARRQMWIEFGRFRCPVAGCGRTHPPIHEDRPKKRRRNNNDDNDNNNDDDAATAQSQESRKTKRKRHCRNCGGNHCGNRCTRPAASTTPAAQTPAPAALTPAAPSGNGFSQAMRDLVYAQMDYVRSLSSGQEPAPRQQGGQGGQGGQGRGRGGAWAPRGRGYRGY